MNKLKYLYIISLSILFLNNNIISMEKTADEQNEQSLILCLPDELIACIIEQYAKEYIKNWNDIFYFNQADFRKIRLICRIFNRCYEEKRLIPLIQDLKQKRFLELFVILKDQSQKEYKDLYSNTLNLNQKLIKILNKDGGFITRGISKDDLKTAIKLILADADANARDKHGYTILMKASETGSQEIVKILIQVGAKVNTKDYVLSYTPLNFASRNGHKVIVKMLIQAYANANATDKHGYTALIHASKSGHKEIVKTLISSDADVNTKDTCGHTALMHASKYGHKEIVEILTKADADVNAISNIGYTALRLASENNHEEITKILIQAGAISMLIPETEF